MSSRELIESLRQSGEEKARAIRLEADQEADALKAAADKSIADLEKRYADDLELFKIAEQRTALTEAGSAARLMLLDAETKLSDALFSIARFSLHQLRDDGYAGVFGKLARELPSLPWRMVSANARDSELVRRHFPDARIESVGHIAGGFEATLADDSIRIINTFEKRLERIWPELLPQMIREIEQELR